VSGFIDGEGDQVRKPLEGFAADVFLADRGSGGPCGSAVKVVGYIHPPNELAPFPGHH
jgi:hypothetical protein